MHRRAIRLLLFVLMACCHASGQLPGVSYAISGHIRNSQGQPIANVNVAPSTGNSTQTDGTGFYLLAVSNNFSGSITPSLSGYTFSPSSRPYSAVSADQSNQDFTGT